MSTMHSGQPSADNRSNHEAPDDVEEMMAVTGAAAREFTKPPRRTAALTYLRQRGIDTTVLPQSWALGYAPPGWTRLVDTLRRQHSDDVLLAAGLARRSSRGTLIDAFRDRVIFPIRNHNGATVAFIGRDLSGQDRTPKYLNSATSAIYRKSELLYGDSEHALADGAVRGAQPVLLEGPVDVLAILARARADQRSDLLPIAPSGTAVTTAQADRIAALAFAAQTPAVVAFDADSAGRAAALRVGAELRSRGVDVRIAAMPQGSDPAAYLTRTDSNLDTFSASHAVPLLTAHVEAVIAGQGDHMQWIEGRLAAARLIAADLATYPISHATRQIGWIANALDLTVPVMARELVDAFRNVDHRSVAVARPTRGEHTIEL